MVLLDNNTISPSVHWGRVFACTAQSYHLELTRDLYKCYWEETNPKINGREFNGENNNETRMIYINFKQLTQFRLLFFDLPIHYSVR